MVGLKMLVDAKLNPIVEALLGNGKNTEKGKTLSVLGINLDMRRRVKFVGRVVAKAKRVPDKKIKGVVEAQLIIKIDVSMGRHGIPGEILSLIAKTSR